MGVKKGQTISWQVAMDIDHVLPYQFSCHRTIEVGYGSDWWHIFLTGDASRKKYKKVSCFWNIIIKEKKEGGFVANLVCCDSWI